MANSRLIAAERGEIGRRLYDYVTSGLNAKGGQPEDIWAPVERFHRNEAAADPGAGLIPIHEPLSQPRQDALTSQVCMVLGRQDPYMLAECVRDPQSEDSLQRLLHRLWQQAGFEMQIRKACTISTDTNKGVLRLCPKTEQKTGASSLPGVQIDVIHPKDFVCYPAGLDGIADAVLVGHRFYRRVGRVKDLMAAGRYYDAYVVGSDPDEHDETGAAEYARTSLGSVGSDRDAELTELFECVVRLRVGGGREELYQAVLAMANQELLLLDRYPYSRPWYFQCPLIADSDGFWGGKSVGRNLYPIQDYYNKLSSLIYRGASTASAPPIFGPKLTEKYTLWKAGDLIESDEPGQPWSPSIRVDLSGLVSEKMNCERLADMVARVSQNTLGANNAEADTATENSIIASGVAVGIEEYIANFSSEFPSMAEHTMEVAKGMYGNLVLAYPDCPDPAVLDIPAVWETAGKSPSNTPSARIQAAMQAIQLVNIPGTGIDPYELARVVIANSGLSNVDGVQFPKPPPQPQPPQVMPNAQPQFNPVVGQVPGIQTPGALPAGAQGAAPGPPAAPGPVQTRMGGGQGAG